MARRLVGKGTALLAVLLLASTAFAQGMCETAAQDWEDRFNAGDAAGVAALYTDDGMLRHANGVVDWGSEELLAFAQDSVEAGFTIEVTEDSLERVAEGAMVGLGTFVLFGPDDEPIVGGDYIVVYVVQDGTCLYHRHFSAADPPEEM